MHAPNVGGNELLWLQVTCSVSCWPLDNPSARLLHLVAVAPLFWHDVLL